MTEENIIPNSPDVSSPDQVEVVGARRRRLNDFDTVAVGKRKRAPGDVLLGESMIQAIYVKYRSHFFPIKYGAAQNRHFRGFVQDLSVDEDLPLFAQGGQREMDVLYDALKVLDDYRREVRHYTWDDCLDAFRNAVGRETGSVLYKEGIGLVVPFDDEEMTVVVRKKAHIESAFRQLEDKEEDKQALLHMLLTGPRGREYEGAATRVDTAEATHGSAALPAMVEDDDVHPISREANAAEASAQGGGGEASAVATMFGPTIAEVEQTLAALKIKGASDGGVSDGGVSDMVPCPSRRKTPKQVSDDVDRWMAAKERSPSSQPQDSYLRKGPLSEEQEKTVNGALKGSGHDIVVTAFNTNLTRQDLWRLQEYTWLNDAVVNMYMKLLDHRDKELCERDKSRCPSHFFSSFFLTKLTENRKYNYAGVKRWTKKVKIFEMDKVFCPVNINNIHWCMAVIFVQKKRINYYDSMGGTGAQTTDALMKWLADEDHDKNGDDGTFFEEEWSIEGTDMATTPQQDNGSDCGAFAIAFASYLSDDLPFDFSQADIAEIRRRMLWSLVHQELI